MHCGLYTCYVQELVAEAATKAVWKALHLVLLMDDKGLLPLQLWDIQCENTAANLDQCLVLLDYYRVKYLWAGMNIQRCIWGFRFGPPRAIQTTQLWRELWSWQMSILAFDIDLFFVAILSCLTGKQHWNLNGAPFQCWFLLTWSGWWQERRVNPETKVGSSTEQLSSKCLCLYWS